MQLVNADQPFWLIGLTEMTRTFGLELLELILSSFPDVFFKVSQCLFCKNEFLPIKHETYSTFLFKLHFFYLKK